MESQGGDIPSGELLHTYHIRLGISILQAEDLADLALDNTRHKNKTCRTVLFKKCCRIRNEGTVSCTNDPPERIYDCKTCHLAMPDRGLKNSDETVSKGVAAGFEMTAIDDSAHMRQMTNLKLRVANIS